jgi:hypothetical protein
MALALQDVSDPLGALVADVTIPGLKLTDWNNE